MPTNATIQHINGVNLEVLKGTVSAIQAEPELAKCRFRASNKWIHGNHNCTTVKDFFAAKQEMTHKQEFHIHADEPPILAGTDEGANPVEILLGALALLKIRGIYFKKHNGEIIFTGEREDYEDLSSLPLPAKHLLMNMIHQFIGHICPACDQYVQYLLAGTNTSVHNRHRRRLQL